MQSLHQRLKAAKSAPAQESGQDQNTAGAGVPVQAVQPVLEERAREPVGQAPPSGVPELMKKLDERVNEKNLGYNFVLDAGAKTDPDLEDGDGVVLDDGLFLSFSDGDGDDGIEWEDPGFDDDPDGADPDSDPDDFSGLSVEPMPFGGGFDAPAGEQYQQTGPENMSDLLTARQPEPWGRNLIFDETVPAPDLIIAKPADGKLLKPLQIKSFPRELADLVRQQFTVQNSMQDMLAAFVYIKLGLSCPLPAKVLEQARSFCGDAVMESTAKTIAQMNERMQRQEAMLREMELAITWLLFDKMGFTPPVPADPRTAEINLDGVGELMERLKSEAKQKHNQDAIREGRAGRAGRT